MLLSDYDFHLPEELVARHPTAQRDQSRMLLIDRKSGDLESKIFSDFSDYIKPGDALVLNNTKVIPARIFGERIPTRGKVEALLIEEREAGLWQAMLKPGKRMKPGGEVDIIGSNEKFTVEERLEDGTFTIRFSTEHVLPLLDECGKLPLPPYMNREMEIDDSNRYQTVYAEHQGAVAAPTAGLHFTEELLENLEDKGVEIAYVTLHVGPGTFQPVSVDDITDHKMHSESFILPQETVDTLKKVKENGGRIFVVGTTCVRVLESCWDEKEFLIAKEGRTEIFLYPPYQPKVADALLTNFHLPKSTLLMLVSTFTSRENVFNAYEYAIEDKFRFYSYGDCMLLI
ncbi:MAG: tRNA preQ1(34) S-adenosylmethionine ribosyltransferase-isomerase QueA [Lentisphaeraceae bacterium]|nr:tRNA preQ1(34) S-adenosylmethionine ribosyltransferase-isomerase QueA [Lentisphaeraceae bacterium]